MLDEKTIRLDMEKTAREITGRKFWSLPECAGFLFYSYNNMDLILTKQNIYITLIGGKKHIYAIDLLSLFEARCGLEFPDLRREWCEFWKVNPAKKSN